MIQHCQSTDLLDINDSTPALSSVGCRLVDHAGHSEQLHTELARSRDKSSHSRSMFLLRLIN